MNCDQAFDQLTDPTLRDDADLRAHLAKCSRCRQMREVLAPALESFGVAHGSPMDDIGDDAVTLATTTARRLDRRVRASQRTFRLIHSISLVLLGICVGLGAFAVLGTGNAGQGVAYSAQAAQCLWVHPERAETLEASAPAIVLSCVECHLTQAN